MFDFGDSPKKVADDSNWKKLERVAADSPRFDGYKVQTQKQSKKPVDVLMFSQSIHMTLVIE